MSRHQPFTHLVLFLIEGRPYGLPLDTVEQVVPMVEVSPLPSAPEALLGVIDYHGELLPVMDLRARLGLPRREPEITNRLVVVRTTRRKLAIAVDAVSGVRELASEAMHPPAGLGVDLPQVAGMVTLKDGLVIIQDVEAMLSTEEEQHLDLALREVGQ